MAEINTAVIYVKGRMFLVEMCGDTASYYVSRSNYSRRMKCGASLSVDADRYDMSISFGNCEDVKIEVITTANGKTTIDTYGKLYLNTLLKQTEMGSRFKYNSFACDKSAVKALYAFTKKDVENIDNDEWNEINYCGGYTLYSKDIESGVISKVNVNIIANGKKFKVYFKDNDAYLFDLEDELNEICGY